ncbi:helix-turn-helix transcriptional regulator [Alkalicella caledoniensis]|uniref:Helix-turn-helix transcriptional regulator n=1 Tax=Alkalicella caledoniensis TaxID=2731377 RepID=A0A7G9WAU6_ALKCA|nr:helix-turn-helix transcriptional regulator [Alkalicella caledoniensis]QNO15808.1 helix-turn-helix transcriptional regulator [Alkalicella caledoniensis]
MIRIKELRKDKKINQLKLAMDLNITQASISKYEIGAREPSLEILEKMSDYFDVSTDYIIGRSDIKKPILNKELKKEEVELLYKFRKLTSRQKERLYGYLDSLEDDNKK